MSLNKDFNNHFGLSNIPFGIASVLSSIPPIPAQAATRVSGHVIFLAALAEVGHFKDVENDLSSIFKESTLNAFAALPKSVQGSVRKSIQDLLHGDLEEKISQLPGRSVFPCDEVQTHLPVHVGDFTDFSVSVAHNLRAGEAILGKRFLPPAFTHFPLGYGGRSSSVVVSGTPIKRPLGQFVDRESGDEKKVIFAPSRAVDYELEVAAVVGKPVAMGDGLHAKDADKHIFGVSHSILGSV